MMHRTRTKLANGELQVAGDQWPIFLYVNYTYDSEDPWNGLLRSGLLVAVSIDSQCIYCNWLSLIKGVQAHFYIPQIRGSGAKGHTFWQCVYSRHEVCDKGISRICCHTGEHEWLRKINCWVVFCRLDLLWLRHKYFSHRPHHGLQAFLHQYLGFTWWPWRKGWSWSVGGMVESVSILFSW